jgi:hypothetical protein
MRQVRQERTNWRCQEISHRHRMWGYNCPAVDLDFVVAEYNYGKPVALIEYKEKRASMPSFDHPTYKALSDLADNYSGGALPFMVVFYCSEDWWFKVLPVNPKAKQCCSEIAGQYITEERFVRGLYKLRNIKLTSEDNAIFKKLSDKLPDEIAQERREQ